MRNENNGVYNISNNKNLSQNKIGNNKAKKDPQILTSFESKKYNDFLGVFGAHADNSKYFKPKKIIKRKECKTPNKKEITKNILNKNDMNMNEIEINKRNCKSPFKLNNLLFFKKNKDLMQNKNTNSENKIEDKK